MLARYRSLLATRGHDWGDEWAAAAKVLLRFLDWCDVGRVAAVLGRAQALSPDPVPVKELDATGVLSDPIGVVANLLVRPLPAGVLVAHEDNVELRDVLPYCVPGQVMTYGVFVVSRAGGQSSHWECTVSCEQPHVSLNGREVRAVDTVGAGRLRLVADDVSRWTVEDDRGGAWFPEGAPKKFDWNGRPYFHGNNLVVDVPAGEISVTATRGCEFKPQSVVVDVLELTETMVALSPERFYDAASRGWYAGDLHVHMNYSGDLVCTPEDAALMQVGEGLHLMNVLAANCSTSHVYDREAFEHYLGRELPLPGSSAVMSWGMEYRNDCLGHFTVLNPQAPPTRYQTGHRRSAESTDWPPNAVAAIEARRHGGLVTYTHPVSVALAGTGVDAVFARDRARVSDARELVADAALGLVDAVDLGAPSHVDGVEFLYHRLLGCGFPLAATAGTDAMLSHSRHWAHSNPPGWYRAYADLGGHALSVRSWQEAVRTGRTFVTNGPWLELEIGGCGLGETLSCDGPQTLSVVARSIGVGIETLKVVGPDGVVASTKLGPDQETAEIAIDIDVVEPVWLAAVARGDADADGIRGPQPVAYAHTSPVWVTLAGQSVGRQADAEWCLDWLARFEVLIRAHARLSEPDQMNDLLDVIKNAREVYLAVAGRDIQRRGSERQARGDARRP